MHVVGVDPPRPIERFGQAGALDAGTLKALKKAGYSAPTPIQAQALPALMSGRDVLGRGLNSFTFQLNLSSV